MTIKSRLFEQICTNMESQHRRLPLHIDVRWLSRGKVLTRVHELRHELMLVRTKHLHTLPTSITIGNALIPFKHSVKNLGFTLDCHLAMNAPVPNIARTCYFELRRLASIRRLQTRTATATLVSALVLSGINYCY